MRGREMNEAEKDARVRETEALAKAENLNLVEAARRVGWHNTTFYAHRKKMQLRGVHSNGESASDEIVSFPTIHKPKLREFEISKSGYQELKVDAKNSEGPSIIDWDGEQISFRGTIKNLITFSNAISKERG